MRLASEADSLAGRFASGCGYLCLKLLAFAACAFLLAAAAPRPPLPTRFTDMTATQAIPTAAWHGRTTVISYWARWCGPCLVELPTLPALAAANPDLRFVAASLDGRRAANRWLASHPLPGIVSVHAAGTPASILRPLGNGRLLLPFNIVVDAAGRVCAISTYRLDADQLARLLAICRAG